MTGWARVYDDDLLPPRDALAQNRCSHGFNRNYGRCSECKAESLEFDAAVRLLISAVETFRDIAAIKGTSKRQKANSEIAANWLREHGFAIEDGGYIPGKGFAEDNALLRRQAE